LDSSVYVGRQDNNNVFAMFDSANLLQDLCIAGTGYNTGRTEMRITRKKKARLGIVQLLRRI